MVGAEEFCYFGVFERVVCARLVLTAAMLAALLALMVLLILVVLAVLKVLKVMFFCVHVTIPHFTENYVSII